MFNVIEVKAELNFYIKAFVFLIFGFSVLKLAYILQTQFNGLISLVALIILIVGFLAFFDGLELFISQNLQMEILENKISVRAKDKFKYIFSYDDIRAIKFQLFKSKKRLTIEIIRREGEAVVFEICDNKLAALFSSRGSSEALKKIKDLKNYYEKFGSLLDTHSLEKLQSK